MNKKTDYLLPLRIVIAALLIAGSWIYSTGLKNIDLNKNNKEEKIISDSKAPNIENILPVSSSDHIRGNPNAPIKIIEFSDLECPFCKAFHLTMKRIIAEYDGKVAWIYRHYPIEQLHSKAKKSAQASECAAELGGNGKFWEYIDKYFEITPSNNQIDLSKLPQIADDIGLNENQFIDCLNSEKYFPKIEAQIKDALNSGATGTPYSIIINANGKKYEINGALPIDDFKNQSGEMQKGVKSLIEEALK